MNRILGVPSVVCVEAIFPQVFGHHGLGCWLLAPSYFSSLLNNALHFIRTVNKSILRWLPVNMGTDMKEFILQSIMVLWEVTKIVLKLDHVSVTGHTSWYCVYVRSVCPVMNTDFLDWGCLTVSWPHSLELRNGLVRLARWLLWRTERKRCFPYVKMVRREKEGRERLWREQVRVVCWSRDNGWSHSVACPSSRYVRDTESLQTGNWLKMGIIQCIWVKFYRCRQGLKTIVTQTEKQSPGFKSGYKSLDIGDFPILSI